MQRRSQLWLQLTLIIGFTFCLILGVGALAALYLVQAEPATSDATAFPGFRPGAIAPHHALLQLTGDPAAPLAGQAIQAGELDLAAAAATFAVELTDRERLTAWLQLGRRYLAAAETAAAATGFHNARIVAVTGFGLATAERSQALIQIAEGLLQTGDTAAALDAAQQVRILAEQTPDLLPAQRMQIVDALRPVAREIGDETLTTALDLLARNPYLTPTGILLADRWLTLGAPIAADPAQDNAFALRRQAARGLADRFAAGATDYEPERQTLAAALLAEDQARAAAFQARLNAGLPLAGQFTLLQERRAWLGLKLRIASGGFGFALMPEWEAQSTTIRQELAAATSNVVNVVEAIIQAETDPIAQATLRTQAQLWLAQQAEFGLYPDRTPADIGNQLRFAQAELLRLGSPPALPVLYSAEATPPGFRFGSPAALQ